MSFFRRRTFSLSRRPRDRTPQNEVESVSPKPEQESVDFGATNLRLADADSQLYIVINFPAWEGCVVKYPDPGTAAKLMKNLQMNLSNWTISIEIKRVDHFFFHQSSSADADDDLTQYPPVMLVQIYHRPKELNGADVTIYKQVQGVLDPQKKCHIEVWTEEYHQNC